MRKMEDKEDWNFGGAVRRGRKGMRGELCKRLSNAYISGVLGRGKKRRMEPERREWSHG